MTATVPIRQSATRRTGTAGSAGNGQLGSGVTASFRKAFLLQSPPMRVLPLIFIILAGPLVAGQPTAYPLWDGRESVADYAKKVNLPPTKTLDLGNGVKMELMLIPAGKFVMGTPEPTPVDEDGRHKKIMTGEALMAVSGVALLVMLTVIIVGAVRKKQRPKYSLLWFLLMIVMAGGCLLSGLHWRQSANGLELARVEFAVAKAHYDISSPVEKPGHSVTLTQPFYMGKYDVTQEQHQQVVGTNPSKFTGKDNPVERVSWDDAQAFCKKLTEQTKQLVRLPTEAEWEYSCRAGTTTTYNSGDAEADLGRVAWYFGNSKNTTHPAGQKEANAFGLYDMHGNVWQWCLDWHGKDYYSEAPLENPQGPDQGVFRLLRGGAWSHDPMRCRSASRGRSDPGDRVYDIGFRVVVPTFRAP